MLQVHWGNRMEVLADAMFSHLLGQPFSAQPADIFVRRDCIVVPNRIVQHWLLHHFLFQGAQTGCPRVLADVDFPLLHIFVNDWLHRMDHPEARSRDPLEHPFSVAALQWRLQQFLLSDACTEAPVFSPLDSYVHGQAAGEPAEIDRRAFKMAGRLATMFDEYMVYRPAMLMRWEAGQDDALEAGQRWQPALWRWLTAGGWRASTYLAAFCRMDRGLQASGIQSEYRAVHVFGVSMMPAVFVRFFELLGALIPVRFYVLNPCARDWFDERSRRDSLLEGRVETEALFQAGHPLLSEQGRGCRDFLVELLDRTQGQAEAGAMFKLPSASASLLGRLQLDILDEAPAEALAATDTRIEDPSIQLHICHSPLRELEVLHDHLQRAFTENPALQPREVQVQVSDMFTYAPFVDAVFGASGMADAAAIPYVIADQVVGGESPEAEVFRRVLELADSRFSAPDVLDLLQADSVRARCGLSLEAVGEVRRWIDKAGVRWGRDGAHRRQVLGVGFDPPEATTWRRGLDRLLMGYAYGSLAPAHEGGGPLQTVVPSDQVEDEQAVTLGRVAAFYDVLARLSAWSRAPHPPAAWAEALEGWIDRLFEVTDENYRDVGTLRKAVGALRKSALAADRHDPVGLDSIRQFMGGQIKESAGGGDLVQNAVVFSALRPGSSMPRRQICLLGMGDGLFPRRDNRAHYDLLRSERRMGDRSQGIEDRMAFLEAMLSAREVLYISYTGFSVKEGREIQAAIPVEALREHLVRLGGAGVPLVVRHRLQAHHPAYFDGCMPLFSCSRERCQAARVLQAKAPVPVLPSDAPAEDIHLEAVTMPAEILEVDEIAECLANPARYYYRRILKVRLDADTDKAMEDNEEFDPTARTGYAVNQQIVNALLETPPVPPERIRHQLQADGLLPLRYVGELWFARRLEQVRALLALPLAGQGEVGALARRAQVAVPQPLAVSLGPLQLTGHARLFPGTEAADLLALDVRWANPRAVDPLIAWLHHLLACVAGLNETRLFLASRPDAADKRQEAVFVPLPADEAREQLRQMVAACLMARTRPLPFSPETACAYLKKWRDGRGAAETPEQRHAQGMVAARHAWLPTEFGGEMRDVYLCRAFGEAGPFARELAFASLARRLMEPMLQALDN